MSAGHTLGPWEFVDNALVGPKIDNKPIWLRPVILRSEVGVRPDDARLIASAPELLAERDRLKATSAELADALKKLINRTADIEVLGEWLAMGMNHQHAALVRASVNRDIAAARSALAKHIKEVA